MCIRDRYGKRPGAGKHISNGLIRLRQFNQAVSFCSYAWAEINSRDIDQQSGAVLFVFCLRPSLASNKDKVFQSVLATYTANRSENNFNVFLRLQKFGRDSSSTIKPTDYCNIPNCIVTYSKLLQTRLRPKVNVACFHIIAAFMRPSFERYMNLSVSLFYFVPFIQEAKLLELSPDPLTFLFWYSDAPSFLRLEHPLDKRTLEVIFFLVLHNQCVQTGPRC